MGLCVLFVEVECLLNKATETPLLIPWQWQVKSGQALGLQTQTPRLPRLFASYKREKTKEFVQYMVLRKLAGGPMLP